MKTILRIVLLLVASALPSFGDGKAVTFADLPIGDTIVVTYSSTGCFHYNAFEFTYSRSGEGSFEVQELSGPAEKPSKKRLGLILLERGEAKTLDKWIAANRNGKTEVVSSTTNSFRLVQLHEGRVVNEESIEEIPFFPEEENKYSSPITFEKMAFDLKKRELPHSDER